MKKDLKDLKLERKPIIYGLVTYVNNAVGSNITYEQKATKMYKSSDDIWCNDTVISHNFKDDDDLLFSIRCVSERVVGSDGIVQRKYSNVDKYISYNVVKLIFMCISQKYDIDLMNILDEITECDWVRNFYIEKDSIDEVYDRYLSQKKLVR